MAEESVTLTELVKVPPVGLKPGVEATGIATTLNAALVEIALFW